MPDIDEEEWKPNSVDTMFRIHEARVLERIPDVGLAR
jgi:hypothetical protein